MPPAYTVRFRLTVRKKRDVSPPGGMNASPTVFFATFPKQPDKHQFIFLSNAYFLRSLRAQTRWKSHRPTALTARDTANTMMAKV